MSTVGASSSAEGPRPREVALTRLAISAAHNIPGVEFASITVYERDGSLRTVAASDALARKADELQYELREGPCYAAVTEDRVVVANDVTAGMFPRYGPKAAALGVRAQAAMQLVSNGQRAGLNLYARRAQTFDHATIQVAELFANQAAALLEYVEQVEQLSEAVHTRTDIGTTVGIIMERYQVDRDRAFAFLVRNSQDRNIKVRHLAQRVIDGTFESTTSEDRRSQQWP